MLAVIPLAALGQAGEATGLDVRETAGIRRFGYPVAAELKLDPPLPESARFRLLEGGKPVQAQFRALEAKEGLVSRVAIDFEGYFLPFETRRYTVARGTDVEGGPEPEHGLTIEQSGGAYRISNGPQLVYEVADDLSGLLRAVRSAGRVFLEPGSDGLVLRVKGGERRRLAAGAPEKDSSRKKARGRVSKRGPIDCALYFEGEEDLGNGAAVRYTVELEFPRSKSWFRATWSIEDPEDRVEAMGAGLRLRLEGERSYADFGADTLVYAALEKGQAAAFRAGLPTLAHRLGGQPFWEVLRGPPGKLEPYVASGLTGLDRVDGWAHLMDRERCTALAVRDFGRKTEDSIEVDAAGRLELWRDFSKKAAREPVPKTKTLVFWVHFVDFPPHVGAVTSPQSMMSPLETTWRG